MTVNDKNLQFPVPNDLIEPYIRHAITTVIANALGEGGKWLDHAVSLAINDKVQADGTVSEYESDNTSSYLEVITKNKIKEIAKDIIVGMVEELRPKIKKDLEEKIRAKHKEIASVLFNRLMAGLKFGWNISVTLPLLDR